MHTFALYPEICLDDFLNLQKLLLLIGDPQFHVNYIEKS